MPEKEQADTYAIVGELVLIASALDAELNRVTAAALRLGDAPLLLPVIAAFDPPRKIEMLRARVSHFTRTSWKHALLQFLGRVETVNNYRDLACRTPTLREGGRWMFKPTVWANLLEPLDLGAKKPTPRAFLRDLKSATALGEHALREAVTIRCMIEQSVEEWARREAVRVAR